MPVSENEVFWKGAPRRVIAPYMFSWWVTIGFLRVELFGIAALIGW